MHLTARFHRELSHNTGQEPKRQEAIDRQYPPPVIERNNQAEKAIFNTKSIAQDSRVNFSPGNKQIR
jgi:hypothetical protein